MKVKFKLRRVGSKRFWSAVGAALSVVATLWATLIGQTIPQLLSSTQSSRSRFIHEANNACAGLPAAPGMAVPGPGGRSELPRDVEMRSSDAILGVDDKLDRRVDEPFIATAQALLAIEAPASYTLEYRAFEMLLSNTDLALDELEHTLDLLQQPAVERSMKAYRAALARLLDADNVVFSKVRQLIDRGRLLQLNECVLGLAGIGTELQLLNDDFVT